MIDNLPLPSMALEDFDGIPIWTDAALFAACGVRIAFSGRRGGVSAAPYDTLNLGGRVNDDMQSVKRNRARLMEALRGSQCALVVPVQVHGTDILFASAADPGEAERQDCIEADAVVVAQGGLGAQLSFADCLPLIIVAPSGAFAVAHAGWRGALAGIAGKAASALEQVAGCDARSFNAYIGPHIHSECFETGADVAESFASAYGAEVLRDSRHVDLSRAVGVDLERAGMQARRIADCGVCTVCCSDGYFSYRASGGVCGRNGALAFRV